MFALPCVEAADGDRDILPNAVKEAMASGVPVVTTRLDGITELIEDGVSGLLVNPGDPADLASKMDLLLSNPPLRQQLAANGRQVIEERFDRRSNFAQLRALLMEAVQSSGSAVAEHAPATADGLTNRPALKPIAAGLPLSMPIPASDHARLHPRPGSDPADNSSLA